MLVDDIESYQTLDEAEQFALLALGPHAIPVLEGLLDDGTSSNAEAAAAVLGQLGADAADAVPTLLQAQAQAGRQSPRMPIAIVRIGPKAVPYWC